MTTELSQSANRAALALGHTLCERLAVDAVDAHEIHRSARTLATLIGSISDQGSVADEVDRLLERLMTHLAVRLGESIDGAMDDDAFDLGRALDVVSGLRRRRRRVRAS